MDRGAWQAIDHGVAKELDMTEKQVLSIYDLYSATHHLYLSQSFNRATCVMSLSRTLQCLLT